MRKKISIFNNSGFSLIELLVVISIIGLLSSLAVVSLNSAREKARDAVRKADMSQLRTALNLYYDDELEYPDCDGSASDDANISCYSGTGGDDTSLQEALIDDPSKPYIGSLPLDPRNPTNTTADDPTYFYGYNWDDTEEAYTIYCALEDGGDCSVTGY